MHFGWAACVDCLRCVMFKSKLPDGTVKLYGTKNMVDHMKSYFTASTQQTSMTSFIKRAPGKKFTDSEKAAIKASEARHVAEAGLSFAFVDNPGFRSFDNYLFRLSENMVTLMLTTYCMVVILFETHSLRK